MTQEIVSLGPGLGPPGLKETGVRAQPAAGPFRVSVSPHNRGLDGGCAEGASERGDLFLERWDVRRRPELPFEHGIAEGAEDEWAEGLHHGQ